MLLTIAWRNLWRNKRRTLITISAVMFATWFSVAMRGIQLGTYENQLTYALNLFSGFVQIQPEDYLDSPSLRNSFLIDDTLTNVLRSDVRVVGFAPRVVADGLISFGDNSQGAMILGVDPEKEKRVTTLHARLREGRMPQSDTAMEIVLGQILMQNLRADIGDDIVLLSQGYDGALGNARFRIVGALRTGMQDFDRGAVFVGISALQDLLNMQGRINLLAVTLHDLRDVRGFCREWNAEQRSQRALPWQEVMPDLKQSIDLDNYSGMLFLAILMIVVAFGILNTVLMSVTERFREFGILLSIGMPRGTLVVQVLFETLFIALLGILIGNILGFVTNWYFAGNPIVFTGAYAEMIEEYGWLPELRSIVRWSSFLNTSVSVIVIVLLSSLYPLYRVFTLEALKGLRHT
jgi:putative ABC transport system permease protein